MSQAAGRDAHSIDSLAEPLAAFVAAEERLPAGRVRAANLRRLAGGASREIWSLDLTLERDGGSETATAGPAQGSRRPRRRRRRPQRRAVGVARGVRGRRARAAAALGHQ